MNPFVTGLCEGVLRSPLKGVHALSRSQRMAAIALTIIILLNYLAFYYAYGAFEGSVGTKKKRFFSRQKSRRCAPGGGEEGGGQKRLTFPGVKAASDAELGGLFFFGLVTKMAGTFVWTPYLVDTVILDQCANALP